MEKTFDFDQIIIGTGFGGSCSALRLSEKGYKVLMLEKGKRWKTEDFPKTNMNPWKSFWFPWLGMGGLFQARLTNKFSAVYGAGVGGGSLVYGNTHLVPDDCIFERGQWSQMYDDWGERLRPYYGLAQRMLGVQMNRFKGPADEILEEVAHDMGRGDTYSTLYSGILYPEGSNTFTKNIPLDKLGLDRGDPYFSGEGPDRNSCRYCGGCMQGCRFNAKNTLDKNYLHFAERNGVEIRPESMVYRIEALKDDNGKASGNAGYKVFIKEGIHPLFGRRYTLTAEGVICAGSVLGSIPLLLKMRDQAKTLPNISKFLGSYVRTNSETMLQLSHRRDNVRGQREEVWEGTGLTSIFAADDETNVEIARYPKGSDAIFMAIPGVPLTDKAGALPRWLSMLLNILRNPLQAFRILWPFGAAATKVFLIVLGKDDTFVHFETRRRWWKLFMKTWTPVYREGDKKLSNYFPIGHEVARRYAEKSGGDIGNLTMEIVAGIPNTAHMMGGAVMGKDSKNSVIDATGEVHGYPNLRILDASIISGNLGVNPSLTILALTEHAMSMIPVKDKEKTSEITPVNFSPALEGNPSCFQEGGFITDQIYASKKT